MFHFCSFFLSFDIKGVHTGTPTNTIDNQADFDNNTTSKSNGKDCSSLERIVRKLFYYFSAI